MIFVRTLSRFLILLSLLVLLAFCIPLLHRFRWIQVIDSASNQLLGLQHLLILGMLNAEELLATFFNVLQLPFVLETLVPHNFCGKHILLQVAIEIPSMGNVHI